MEVIRGIQHLNRTLKNAVVTIGNFDGVHLGHRKIIELTLKQARSHGGPAVVYTFRPHPQISLHPEGGLQLLSTYDEKIALLSGLKAELLIEEPFSREFSTTPPEQFFNDVLLRRLNAREIIVGYDFAFGKGRAGHLDALEQFCEKAGVTLTVVPPLRVDEEIVSSTRIRQHLLSGDVEAAARLLGRPFSYEGVVIKGDQRGRQLGFPTANLKIENKLVLPYGVYATRSVFHPSSKTSSQACPSVTNVGVRPSFAATASADGTSSLACVETYLFDQDVDLYGTVLKVSFVKRLREERKFSGPDFLSALKAQISADVAQAREILRSSSSL